MKLVKVIFGLICVCLGRVALRLARVSADIAYGKEER